MQTLVRVFFDENQIVGVVIPDHDEALDLHHKTLVDVPHSYVDLRRGEYMQHAFSNGYPDIQNLHPVVKNHPTAKVAVK